MTEIPLIAASIGTPITAKSKSRNRSAPISTTSSDPTDPALKTAAKMADAGVETTAAARTIRTTPTTRTTAVDPIDTFQCNRVARNAPTKISRNDSGRSGITGSGDGAVILPPVGGPDEEPHSPRTLFIGAPQRCRSIG